MSTAQSADFHEGDIVRNRKTGGKLVVRGDESVWLPRFYELVACPHKAESSECRRVIDPAPVPFAVQKHARRTCIEAFADGWCLADDLCGHCTRQLMEAVDGIAGPLKWAEGFLARASEGVAR